MPRIGRCEVLVLGSFTHSWTRAFWAPTTSMTVIPEVFAGKRPSESERPSEPFAPGSCQKVVLFARSQVTVAGSHARDR
jgi:hypothetical protein